VIDFVKIWITGEYAKAIRRNRALDWDAPFNELTGEIKIKAWAYIGTMKIKVLGPNRIEIAGSLHQYWNDFNGNGKVNWNRFTYPNLCAAIHSLCKCIGLPPERLPLCVVEYGLNIENPSFDVSEAIDRFLYLYTNRFDEYTTDCGKWVNVGPYWLKIYNKQKQARLLTSMMRVELHICKMDYFKKRRIKIETLADLMRPESLLILHKELVSRLRAATVHETNAPIKKMKPEQRRFWKLAANPNRWKQWNNAELSEANKSHKAIKTEFCKTSTNEVIAGLLNAEFISLSGASFIDSKKSYRVEATAQAKNLTTPKTKRSKKSYPLDERYDFLTPRISPTDSPTASMRKPRADGVAVVEVELDQDQVSAPAPACIGRDLFGNPIGATEATPKGKGKGKPSGNRRRSITRRVDAGAGQFGLFAQ
jgi:hypothetical protein